MPEPTPDPQPLARARRVLAQVPPPDDPRALDLAQHLIETMASEDSAELYARVMAAWFRWCDARGLAPLEVTRRDAERWKVAMQRMVSGNTTRNRLAVLRTFYSRAVEDGYMAASPFAYIKIRATEPTTPTPALTQSEFEGLLDQLMTAAMEPGDSLVAHRDLAAIYLMGRVGIRRREMCRLRWGDVSLETGAFTVHGKGGKNRTRWLPEDVTDRLLAWLRLLTTHLGRPPARDEPVMPALTQHGLIDLASGGMRPLSLTVISRAIRAWMADAGLLGRRYAPHALRATAATLAHEHGADVLQIAYMLRHDSLASTMLYIRRLDQASRSAATTWKPRMNDDTPAR